VDPSNSRRFPRKRRRVAARILAPSVEDLVDQRVTNHCRHCTR
jgi:hypothetical protein